MSLNVPSISTCYCEKHSSLSDLATVAVERSVSFMTIQNAPWHNTEASAELLEQDGINFHIDSAACELSARSSISRYTFS